MWSLPITKVDSCLLVPLNRTSVIIDWFIQWWESLLLINYLEKSYAEVTKHKIKNDLCLTWLLCLFILHQSLMTTMTRPGLLVNSFWTLLTNMPLLSNFTSVADSFPIWHPNGGELLDRLWNKYRKLKTEANWLAYKRQRNLCTSLRRKAITGYFRNKTNNLSYYISQIVRAL